MPLSVIAVLWYNAIHRLEMTSPTIQSMVTAIIKWVTSEVKSFLIQKQPSCKKVYSPQEGHCEKWSKSEMAAKKWLWWKKILIMTIQENLCCLLHVSLAFGTKNCHIKIFAINLSSQPFLGCRLAGLLVDF